MGTIYRLDCECSNFYIGETSRPLWERVAEHLRAFKNPTAPSYKNYALARHRNTTNHTNEDLPSIRVTILAQARRSVDRKIAEASLILELKPPLNEKDEMEDIDLLIG